MPCNPKKYRQHALRCAELEHIARTPELKKTLLDLSRSWHKLAIDGAFGGPPGDR